MKGTATVTFLNVWALVLSWEWLKRGTSILIRRFSVTTTQGAGSCDFFKFSEIGYNISETVYKLTTMWPIDWIHYQ